MMFRMFAALGSATLIVAMSAAEVDAARVGRWGHRRAWNRNAPRNTATQRVAKQHTYPRVRQIEGKTLWNLGKQKGAWPLMPWRGTVVAISNQIVR